MKSRRLLVGLALFLLLILPTPVPSQDLGTLVRGRAVGHFLFWAVHHSVISQDGTFVKLYRQVGSTGTDTTSGTEVTASWSFQVVPLSGDSHDLALPGFPSLFAFGGTNELFVTIPDPNQWKNVGPGKFPTNAKTTLYIIPSPYDDTALKSAVIVDIAGFVGSLRVRNIDNQVLAYMTVRNLKENPSVDTTEVSELDHHLVVVNSAGDIVKDVELKMGPGKGSGSSDTND
ncbi:MAG TPA: hypothetical protein VMW38_24060 [Terriglobia bacterium]|nr:hypothetical protein [Terriglobia bacterium]